MSSPAVLQLVGLQLVHEADTAALVAAHVQHNAAPLLGHHLHRRVQLRAAIATARTEYVTCQTLGVHAHQHVISVTVGTGDIAQHQCHVFYVVVDAGVAHRTELAVLRGDAGLCYPLHMLLVLAPPLDQVGDRHQRQIVLVGEDPEFLGLRHGALVFG